MWHKIISFALERCVSVCVEHILCANFLLHRELVLMKKKMWRPNSIYRKEFHTPFTWTCIIILFSLYLYFARQIDITFAKYRLVCAHTQTNRTSWNWNSKEKEITTAFTLLQFYAIVFIPLFFSRLTIIYVQFLLFSVTLNWFAECERAYGIRTKKTLHKLTESRHTHTLTLLMNTFYSIATDWTRILGL